MSATVLALKRQLGPRRIVWHYTYSHNIEKIIKSGTLLPPALIPDYIGGDVLHEALHGADRGVKADRKLLLFSEREDWEPASFRGVMTPLGPIDLHSIEEHSKHIDIFRIGVDTRHLKPYGQLCRLVSMPRETRNGLRDIAVKFGSNPCEWWGTTKPVPRMQWVAVEKLVAGKWQKYDYSEWVKERAA